MKKMLNRYTILLFITLVSLAACKKDYGNLNSPTVEEYLKNASRGQLNGLVIGVLSGMRISEGTYLDAVGVVGREIYRFSSADPRFVTELLGSGTLEINNSSFYLTNPWASRYRVVKNCNVLIEAATNSSLISAEEKKAYTGFAKTLKAYELLKNLNLTYTNGIRIDVADPANPGPILPFDEAIAGISAILDEGKSDLAGSQLSFPLTPGFAEFKTAVDFTKFNRALAARVDVYRKQWATALTDLSQSFLDLTGNFNTGVSEQFGTGSGDILNPAFFPQNQNGEVRLAHPSFMTQIAPNDDRAAKASQRTTAASYPGSGLSGDKDVWVYTSSTAPIPVIRNEELILIYAEANIQTDQFNEAVDALNIIRNGHNLPDYSGALTKDALINEMLNQRRYSLFYEGHRWIDMRRYDKLNLLPKDRPDDDIWESMPIPSTEL